jgi:PAS domain S-box-containing protein
MANDPIKVLLVEDNPVDTQFLREVLAGAKNVSFDVECVDRLAIGMRRLAAGGIGLVLLDLLLPDSKGLAAFSALHASAPRVPVIVLSHLDDETLALRTVQEGAQDYLVKAQMDSRLLLRAVQYAIERARSEETLRESEERFRVLVEGTTDYAIFMIDPDGHVASWNAGAARMSGYSAEEIIGQPFAHFFTDEDVRSGAPEHALAAAAREGRSESEGWRVRKDGSRFWVNSVLTPLRDAAGTLRGYWKIIRDLTQIKQNEEKFRGLLESAPDAVVIVQESGLITLVNRQTEILFGYSRAELLGQPVEMLLPERYRQQHVGYRTAYAANPSARPMGAMLNLFGRRKDGAEVPVEISLSPMKTDDGTLIISGIRDISQRRRIEESLRSSEERFRALTQSINDAVISADTAGEIVFWNKGAQAIFGYTEEEVVGQPLTLLMPVSFREAHVVGLKRLQATGQSRLIGKVVELVGRRKDGSEFPLELSLAAWETAQGKFVSGVLRDITLRKQAEEALEETRRFVQRIAEMTPSILYVYDIQKQRNIFVNRRLETILGYAWEEHQHPTMPTLLSDVHPDDLARVAQANEQCQAAEDGAVIEAEFRVRHASGEWRWLSTRNTVFGRDGDGNPTQILGAALDITDRKRLEQEVLEIAALEQRRIGQELHDGTGQELTGLCMLADNLADALKEAAPDHMPMAQRIARGLRQALGQVRLLSRGLIPVEVDAEGLMAALTELAERISDLHAVHCVFEVAEPVPVDDNYTATQLYRIAQEAITNALKHGQANNVRVSLEARGDYITLRVADDGIGLPHANEPHAGMGLRIMRYRAGQIGAHLTVRSGPTGGTVVACTLYMGASHG